MNFSALNSRMTASRTFQDRSSRRGGSGSLRNSAAVKILQLASLSMSCASFLGSGHRLEFYGEDGTLVLHNKEADYMRGFELFHARRPAEALTPIVVEDAADAGQPDGRIAPVSRLAKRFLDAIKTAGAAQPDFAAGYRVQQLIDAAQRSHREGRMIATAPGEMPA